MKTGDLVYRKQRQMGDWVYKPSSFYGMGVIIEPLWKIDGMQYYSVHWFRLKKTMNASQDLLISIEQAKCHRNQGDLWEKLV